MPDVILVSLIFSVSNEFAMRAIAAMRSIWPETIVVVGGTHPTNCTEQLLANPDINYVARGEGEIGLSQFLAQIAEGEPIDVQGFYSLEDLGQRPMELCEFVTDLDSLPLPDWELLDMDVYTQVDYVTLKGRSEQSDRPRRSAVFLGTRGCPGLCTFCSQHSVHGRRLRYRSPENIAQELKSLHELYGVTTFVPNDDMFLSRANRDVDMLSRITALDIPDLELQFPNGLHVNSLHPPVMDAVISAGAHIVNVAIESGCEQVQKHVIRKYVNLRKAPQVVRYFRDRGVSVRCFFILGFPGETRQQMQETIDYARALQADWCDFFLAIPLVGSEMHDQFVDMGVIPADDPLCSKAYVLGRTFDTPEITAADLKELAYRANLECNFLHNANMTEGRFDQAAALFEDVVQRYPFHVVGWHCLVECYGKLGRADKADRARATLENRLKTDTLALEMHTQYADLLPPRA